MAEGETTETPQDAIPLPKIRPKDLVEFLSLFSGISFVLSGLFEGALFWLRWRINYFEIAQPADLIMAAFSVVPTLLFAFIFAFIFVFGERIAWAFYEDSIFFKSLDEASALKRAFKWYRRVSLLSIRATAIFFFIVSVVVMLWLVGVHLPFVSRRLPPNAIELRKHPRTNLVLGSSDPQFAACGPAPILWYGTASAILICRDKLRVVHNSQGMIFDRADPEIDRVSAMKLVPKPAPKVVPSPKATPAQKPVDAAKAKK